MTSSPVAAAGPAGPVGRSVGEIRADLAHCDRDGVPWPEAARRLLADVPGLLAEVEAAHRFELAAGVEREALLAELESLRGVVQAVEAACVELDALAAEQESHTGTLLVAVARAYRDATKTVRAALAAAADAPQPAPARVALDALAAAEREDQVNAERPVGPSPAQPADPPTWGYDSETGDDGVRPSPAVLPEKEQQR